MPGTIIKYGLQETGISCTDRKNISHKNETKESIKLRIYENGKVIETAGLSIIAKVLPHGVHEGYIMIHYGWR